MNLWKPKVSIVIPVYNGSNYMREAINSALNQTYENIEIIVVNDGSSDEGETERIALEYGERIRYFRKENGGVSSALNYGISKMTGEYFSWLSHDDVYSPEKIQHHIDALSKTKNKKTVGLCGHCFINENSEHLSKRASKRFFNGEHDWKNVLREIMTYGAFSGCALLIPKVAFDECGLFHEGLRFSQDALMWMKIFLSQYSLIYNDDIDVYSRIHSKQLTQRGREIFKKDSLEISRLLIPEITALSNRDENYLYLFAKRNSKNGVDRVVNDCIKIANENKLFGLNQVLVLRLGLLYGNIRPILRKLYYKFFVRTE